MLREINADLRRKYYTASRKSTTWWTYVFSFVLDAASKTNENTYCVKLVSNAYILQLVSNILMKKKEKVKP
jgi:hypothetical protein